MPCGLVDDGDEAQRDREPEHHPDLHDIGEHDEPQRDREHRGERLGDQQDSAAVESIRDRAAPQAEQQHRKEPERERRTDRDAVAGEVADEPGLGHRLHPPTDVRHEIAGEIQPVVVGVERPERAAHRTCTRSAATPEIT